MQTFVKNESLVHREPLMWVPYGKTVHRTILPTLLRFAFQKCIVLCGGRQGRRPFTPRTFEKVRSKLLLRSGEEVYLSRREHLPYALAKLFSYCVEV